MAVGIAKVHAGYIPSGLGARTIPVDRLADKNILVFKI